MTRVSIRTNSQSIHNEYMEVVENHIETSLLEKMGPDFDMGAFMGELSDHIKSAEEEDKSMADTIEFLTSFGDFEAFKVHGSLQQKIRAIVCCTTTTRTRICALET